VQGEPFTKLTEMPVVKLQPLLVEESKTMISVTFRYSQQIYETLKYSGLATWQQEPTCFAIPGGEKCIQQRAEELNGVGWLWLSQEPVVRDVVLLREKGTDLRYIQTLLGHRSSKWTTEVYTHLTPMPWTKS
jgi:integrase/recombinase XerD